MAQLLALAPLRLLFDGAGLKARPCLRQSDLLLLILEGFSVGQGHLLVVCGFDSAVGAVFGVVLICEGMFGEGVEGECGGVFVGECVVVGGVVLVELEVLDGFSSSAASHGVSYKK